MSLLEKLRAWWNEPAMRDEEQLERLLAHVRTRREQELQAAKVAREAELDLLADKIVQRLQAAHGVTPKEAVPIPRHTPGESND